MWGLRNGVHFAVLYAVLATALGVALNRLCALIRLRSAWARAPLKLAVVVAVLCAIGWALPALAFDWQNTTPGVVFVSVLFGTQASLFGDLTTLV